MLVSKVSRLHYFRGSRYGPASEPILEYVNQYATNIHDDADEEEGETDGELSEVEDFNSDGEDEPAGKLEDV